MGYRVEAMIDFDVLDVGVERFEVFTIHASCIFPENRIFSKETLINPPNQ